MIVPQDEEVELELEAIAIAVLQVDGLLIVLALALSCSTQAPTMPPFVLFSRSSCWWHIQGSFKGVQTVVFNCIVFKIFLMCGLRSSQ